MELKIWSYKHGTQVRIENMAQRFKGAKHNFSQYQSTTMRTELLGPCCLSSAIPFIDHLSASRTALATDEAAHCVQSGLVDVQDTPTSPVNIPLRARCWPRTDMIIALFWQSSTSRDENETVTASWAFRIAAPETWNSLPFEIRSTTFIRIFHQLLKNTSVQQCILLTGLLTAPLSRCLKECLTFRNAPI